MRAVLWVIGLGLCLTIAIVLLANWRFRESVLPGATSWRPAGKLRPATPPMLEGGLAALEARLEQDFPPGSSAAKLEETLREQGFEAPWERQGAPSIRGATFRQTGGDVLRGPYPMVAHVIWQQDEEGQIVWTKANLGYRGL